MLADEYNKAAARKDYKGKTDEELHDIAYSEVVAKCCETLLSDTDAVSRLASQIKAENKTLWDKICEFFRNLAESLKNAYEGLAPGSSIANQAKETVTNVERLRDLWASAGSGAIKNYTSSSKVGNDGNGNARSMEASKNLRDADGQKNTTIDGYVKMQTRTVNGEQVVWIDENILKDNNGQPVHQFIANYIAEHIGEVYTIIESGQKVYIGEDLPGEYTQSKYTKAILRNSPSISKVKNRASANLGEMIEIATNRRWEKTKHTGNKDAKYGMYRYDTKFGFPAKNAKGDVTGANIYRAELLIRNASDGKKYLYDIVSIKKNTANSDWLTQRVTSAARKPAGQKGDVSTNNVAQDTDNVNEKFSLRESVEYTKDLVALHNLTEDKLAKALDLGGFPMPSIAVTKADIPHTNFGDITLVFGRDTIDPEVSRKNTVYSADAWTPTFPQIEYEINDKVGSAANRRLLELESRIDAHFRRDLGRVAYSMTDTLNRYGGEEGFIQHAMDNYGMKAAYLEEHGQHIVPKTKQEKTGVEVSPAMEDKYVKIMDVLGVYSPSEIGALVLKDVREQHGAELEEVYPGCTKTALRLGGVLSRINDWLSGNTGTEYKTVTDVEETKKSVDAVLDTKKYEAWVREMFSGIEKDSGVYNGKDRYTPSGNRRSFKETHLPATLEGIAKAMAAQNGGNTKNVAGFNGIKTLRAGTAERFGSIEAMHRSEWRLKNLTQEQLDKVQDALSSRMYEAMERIDDETGNKHGGSNPLIRYDAIGEIMMEIAEGRKYNVSDIQKIFQKYRMDISDETAMDVKTLLFDVSQMPVNLFEAKPERVVRFDEVKAAIVPSGTDQRIVDRLKDNGVPVQFYTGDSERLEKVNSVENVKFSDRDYSYDALVSKPDMEVTTVSGNVPNNRSDVVYQAKQNAAKIGKFNTKDGSVSVHVKDIDRDVILGTYGLKHSLDRRMEVNAPVTMMAGKIIRNSIKINELTPEKSEADESYVLIGAARNDSGELYVVRSVVNKFSNELSSMDVLYAINAKKGNRLRSMRPGFQGPVTDSTISISELLDYVNEYFPDILPEDVLKHYGHDARPDGKLGESALYSDRNDGGMSNRQLLVNALESSVQHEVEAKRLAEYKENIRKVSELQMRLGDLNNQIKELSFAKGARDKEKLRELRDEKIKTENRINVIDGSLLRLESMQAIKNVLERERERARQDAEKKGRAALDEYRKSAEKKQREIIDQPAAEEKPQRAFFIDYPRKVLVTSRRIGSAREKILIIQGYTVLRDRNTITRQKAVTPRGHSTARFRDTI